MTYKEALEMNESKSGIDIESLSLEELAALTDEIPGWDYPLAEDCVKELARRAKIDVDQFFLEYDQDGYTDSLPHGYDYNDLWARCMEKLGIE